MTQAYFVCPDGNLINVITSHIDTVIKDSKVFGTNKVTPGKQIEL